MAIKTACCDQQTIDEMVQHLEKVFSSEVPTLIVYFATPHLDGSRLATRLQMAFPQSSTIGCTTAGEIVGERMLHNSVVAMALGSDILQDVAIQVMEELHNPHHIEECAQKVSAHFGCSPMQLGSDQHIGMVLFDGLSRAEELVLNRLGDLTNLLFLGGSAGDELQYRSTSVFANGRAYTNAAVVAVLQPNVEFGAIKTQSFRVLGPRFTATQVIPEERRVLTFDHRPAAVVYSEALGMKKEELHQVFMTHPVGLVVGDDLFVRSPKAIEEDNSIIFHCNLLQGMQVSLLESTDIVAETRQAVQTKQEEMGGIQGIINFHCILRTLELQRTNQISSYGSIFSQIPTIGFSTYGESYIGHINQTSTMLVFGCHPRRIRREGTTSS